MTVESEAFTDQDLDTTAPEAIETASPPSDIDDLGSVYDRLVTQNGADRGPDGRFASTNPPAQTEQVEGQQAPENAAGDAAEGAGTDGEGSTASEVSPAPAHLPQAIKDSWGEMKPEVREAIQRVQTDSDRKFGELGRQLEAARPITDNIKWARENLQSFRNLNDAQVAQGVKELAAVQDRLASDPLGTLLDVARVYRVDPQALAARLTGQTAPEGGAQPQNDQTVVALRNQVSELEQQLKKVSDPSWVDERISLTSRQQEVQATWDAMAGDSDNFPHFADVSDRLTPFVEMAMQIAPETASNKDILSMAYNSAINTLEDVRAKVEAAKAAKAAAAAKSDPKRTETARRAASINVTSASGGKSAPKSEMAALGDAYDRAVNG